MTTLPAEDADLVCRLRRGDAMAARALYQRHGDRLLRHALAMGQSRQTAEDIVHDTFVEILRHPDRFDPSRGPVLAYLFGIARHRLSRIARSSLRHSALPLDESRDEDADPADRAACSDIETLHDVGDDLDRARRIERVRAAVLDLPAIQREIIALCDLEELPYSTVALILACPIGTVRSRLNRARAMLASRLSGESDSDRTDRASTPGEQGIDDATLSLSCRGTLT